VITGFGTAPMLQLPGLEAFSGCCRCDTEGTQTYFLYFKCPPTKQMLYPGKVYTRGQRGVLRRSPLRCLPWCPGRFG